MKRVMLIGETRVGKSSLIGALSSTTFKSHRAMAVEYHEGFINTPGEFLENHRFFTALITASADAEIIFMVLDATRTTSLFPPGGGAVFNRQVVGIITKIDLPGADTARAERFLRNTGARQIVRTSTATGEGLDELRRIIA